MTVTSSPGTTGEAAGAAQFSSTSTSSAGAGKVYMGGTVKYGAPKGADSRMRKQLAEQSNLESNPRWLSVNEASADFYNWTKKQQDDFLSKGLVSGLLSAGAGSMEASALWGKLVQEAANYGSLGKEVTPWDILGGYVAQAGGTGPQVKTTTATRTDFTDPATARAIATNAFQSLMGRDPGQGEIAAFAQALASSEASNPVTQSTTTTYDAQGNATDTNTTSAGGVSTDGKALLASDQAKKNPEYGAYQAATTYMNALDSAVYGAPK